MSKLTNLKNAENKYKNLSITEDYTMEEQEEIKKWVEKAKERNQEEEKTSQYVWRVRGSPKNGLRLTKLLKK